MNRIRKLLRRSFQRMCIRHLRPSDELMLALADAYDARASQFGKEPCSTCVMGMALSDVFGVGGGKS